MPASGPCPTARVGPGTSPSPIAVYIKLTLMALFWGGTFVVGRMIANIVPQMTLAAGRFGVAAILLVLLCWHREGGLPRLTRKQLISTFLLGLTGVFLFNVCFFGALTSMPAGRAALFIAFCPVVTALVLAGFFGERLGRVKWGGIALALVGVVIVVTRGEGGAALQDISRSIGRGEILMGCAIAGWVAYTILGRSVLRGLTPLAATTCASLWGLLLLGLGAAGEWRTFDASTLTWQVWLAIFYLGAFGTVICLIWYAEGVKAIGPSRTVMFQNLTPVCGVLLAAVFLSEPILASMLIGGALVIGGVLITSQGGEARPGRPRD